ncbi:MAG: HutD family protein [Bacteriovoracaceae bacterium]|nr:HutD family protein [Bacteriovoracaceae bacterium]
MRIINHSEYLLQRWKNGRGSTREILRSPQEGDLDWRLSMADIVEDGPFSNFPGMERTLILLSGEPIQIQHNDGPVQKLSLLTPYQFSGDAKTYAFIQSQGLDLNFMIRRELGSCHMNVQQLSKGESKRFNGIIFIVKGELKVNNHRARTYDTVDFQTETLEVEALSVCEIIEITLFCNARD